MKYNQLNDQYNSDINTAKVYIIHINIYNIFVYRRALKI